MLPPLSHHALDISYLFNNIQDVADVFAKGCDGYAGREKEAIGATVISAFFHYPDYIFDIERHLAFPDRCSRLLYAALYADFGVVSEAGRKYMEKTIKTLENGLDGNEYDLFTGTIRTAHLRTEQSRRAHLASAMCLGDVYKYLPGSPHRDPNWKVDTPEWAKLAGMANGRRRLPDHYTMQCWNAAQ